MLLTWNRTLECTWTYNFKTKVRMYYRSGTVATRSVASGQLADVAGYAGESGSQTSWPSSWNYRLRWSMLTYLENNPVTFSSRSNLKPSSLRLFEEGLPNKKNSNKMSSDKGSVPDPKSPKLIFMLLCVHCSGLQSEPDPRSWCLRYGTSWFPIVYAVCN